MPPPDELQIQYRYWAKKLHPDKGGNPHDFRKMHDEYEQRKYYISQQEERNYMPRIFHKSESYTYFGKPVNYVGTEYNYYYKFDKPFGAIILIDQDHIHLIKTSRILVARPI